LTVPDLSAPMLDIACAKFRPGERVEFRPADATDLPFWASASDAVGCQFGVMFSLGKDKVQVGAPRTPPTCPIRRIAFEAVLRGFPAVW
jgi:hypothetical protein